MPKGYLLLDVDGPLNPFAGGNTPRKEAGYQRHRIRPLGWTGPPLAVWLHPEHGQKLLDLARDTDLELVWCTTWEDEANAVVGPKVGLPILPVIKFGVALRDLEWKFGEVSLFAEGTPLVWFDDDFRLHHKERDYFLHTRAGIPTLLHTVSPKTGLTDDDFAAVRSWAALHIGGQDEGQAEDGDPGGREHLGL
jgi:hypothetical protein